MKKGLYTMLSTNRSVSSLNTVRFRILLTFQFLVLSKCDVDMSFAVFVNNCTKDFSTITSTVMEDVNAINAVLDRETVKFNTQCFEGTSNILRDMDAALNNETVDILITSHEYHISNMLVRFSYIYNKSIVSKFSDYSALHDANREMYLGSKFIENALTLTLTLDYFKWQNVIVLTSYENYWFDFSRVLHMALSDNNFNPDVHKMDPESSRSEVGNILSLVRDDQKAIVLCMDWKLKSIVLQLAAGMGMESKHAFFLFAKWSLLDETNFVLSNLSGNRTFLDAIFIMHPEFLQPAVKPNIPFVKRRKRSINGNAYNEDSFIHDAYAAVAQAIATFQPPSSINSSHIFMHMQNKTIPGCGVEIRTDKDAEIIFEYVLYDYDSDVDQFRGSINLSQNGNEWQLRHILPINWPNGLPLGEDECFKQTSCQTEEPKDVLFIVVIVIAVLFVFGVAIAVSVAVWRVWIKKELSKGPNKVLLTSQDLVFLQRKDVIKSSKMINGAIQLEKPDLLRASEKPNRSLASLHEYSDFTEIARFNGDLVYVKELKAKGFEMKNKVLTVVKMLRDMRQENVNAVIGFFDDVARPAWVSDYCVRGSLEDVIKNKDIKLDWDFKISLLTDLVRGIRFIHSSPIRWHGNLKSRNCVIDSRWVLKVTDFGVASFLEASKLTPEFSAKDLLWTAPEHLRHPIPMFKGSEKGDVYSFAIIMQETILRSRPYSNADLTPEEIIHKIKHPPPLLRPSVTHQAAPPQYIQIMKVCWSENPDMRPTIEEIYHQFKTITGGKKMNIVDTMFRMLEKYSTDLEDIVRERTLQLEEEKKKTDTLLYRMLPPIVADSLKVGQPVAAESFSEVTIYFSDIVGFTTISAMSTPMEVVDLLNDLYTMFDATIDNYDVYKVETIGDAYMVVSGLPIRNGNRHAGEIGTMALDLLSQCGDFTIRHMPDIPLRVRIGLHSGSCVAGVVGLTMPRYCLFGDTVNTASRMESSGTALRIHVSEETKNKLDELGGYKTEYRGEVELKGKGMAKTYFLLGKEGFDKPLPEPPPLFGLASVLPTSRRISQSTLTLDSARKRSVDAILRDTSSCGKDSPRVLNRRPSFTRVQTCPNMEEILKQRLSPETDSNKIDRNKNPILVHSPKEDANDHISESQGNIDTIKELEVDRVSVGSGPTRTDIKNGSVSDSDSKDKSLENCNEIGAQDGLILHSNSNVSEQENRTRLRNHIIQKYAKSSPRKHDVPEVHKIGEGRQMGCNQYRNNKPSSNIIGKHSKVSVESNKSQGIDGSIISSSDCTIQLEPDASSTRSTEKKASANSECALDILSEHSSPRTRKESLSSSWA